MPAVFHDSFLCTRRAHASEQEWHPIHRSILFARNIFISAAFIRAQGAKRYICPPASAIHARSGVSIIVRISSSLSPVCAS